jgi:hypothetical protein
VSPPRKKPAPKQVSTARPEILRQHVSTLLDWHHAHVTFDQAVADLAGPLRGQRPPGYPHSPWELLEHLRLCQWDILDYCRNPDYREGTWPGDYWPRTAEPPTPEAWEQSIAGFRRDLAALRRMAQDPEIDLLGPLPYAPQATYLRELLLVADHNAYHVGQIVAVRRLLGAWKPA